LILENYLIMQVVLATPGAWHLRSTAQAFEQRGALAGLWISHNNSTGVSPEKFRRCWPLHLALKPFYHYAPEIWTEKAFYTLFPLWKSWLRAQSWPGCDIVQSVIGFATEPFDHAEATGALKVVDCPNSHPTTYFGYWQRECDLWCPGERVPVPRWIFARMNRELDRADMVIVQSNFCRESMVWNGIPASKIFVNPMGVDTGIFQPRQQVPVRPRFISVGTICLRKGHQYLFRAFEQVKKQLPDAELICVGNVKTDFRKEWPKWRGSFTHFPSLTHPEVAKLLQTCTAFVFPSQEEGIARAQIEALAAGVPVIGTLEGGATTLVEDGVEGLIVRGRDPQHIAEAMLRVARDRELCRRMGEAAHKKGAARNTWQDYGDRLLAEYVKRLNR
jgi:glycosyltransferase involved in cell wall biosynthesis